MPVQRFNLGAGWQSLQSQAGLEFACQNLGGHDLYITENTSVPASTDIGFLWKPGEAGSFKVDNGTVYGRAVQKGNVDVEGEVFAVLAVSPVEGDN